MARAGRRGAASQPTPHRSSRSESGHLGTSFSPSERWLLDPGAPAPGRSAGPRSKGRLLARAAGPQHSYLSSHQRVTGRASENELVVLGGRAGRYVVTSEVRGG